MDDNHFFWLGDPENRFMTTEEYNEAVNLWRRAQETDGEGASFGDGVLRTIGRSINGGD